MRAIIPVAGVGSRLRPHTYTIPKVLLNVAGKPIIGHIMDKIIAGGFDSATIVVGYLGDKVKEYITENYSISVDFVEQEERLGLGHAIYLSRHTISKDPVLIILGDTVFDVNLSAMTKGEYSSIGVKEVADPRRFGVAETTNGFVTRLTEKPEHPTSNLAIVGLYFIQHPDILLECLKKMIKSDMRTKGEFQLTDGTALKRLFSPNADAIVARLRALGAALGQMMEFPSQRAALASRAPEVLDRFSMARILDLWEAAFQEARERHDRKAAGT